MRSEDLRALLRQRPFRPFRIFVSDGATYDVTHPEIAIVLPGAVSIHLPASGGMTPLPHRLAFVSLLHISRVEVLIP